MAAQQPKRQRVGEETVQSISSAEVTYLTKLRRELHAKPELSNCEKDTASEIARQLRDVGIEVKVEVGGWGIAAVIPGKEKGPSVLVRCELDALPIEEVNDELPHKSTNNGVAHKCGHDGHMTIVVGLARRLAARGVAKGQVVLVFQPAEETGQGARRFLADAKLSPLLFDYAFALHGVPGHPLGEILVRNGTFTPAVCSIEIRFSGRTAHAAEPHKGVSPMLPVCRFISWLDETLSQPDRCREDFFLVTVVHTSVGEPGAYGVSPGDATVQLTLRSYSNERMEAGRQRIATHLIELTESVGITTETTETEAFAATCNAPEAVALIEEAATAQSAHVTTIEQPMPWGEDFGEFTRQGKGAMFGLGLGPNSKALHNPDFDFPDAVIHRGVSMFDAVVRSLLGSV